MHLARRPVLPLTRERARPCRDVWWRQSSFVAGLVLLDAVAFISGYAIFLQTRAAEVPYLGPMAICLGSIGIVFLATSRYDLRRDTNGVRFAAEHGLACLLAFSLALLLQFGTVAEVSRSRLALLEAFVCLAPMSLVFRRMVGRRMRAEAGLRTLLVIGAGVEAVGFDQDCQRYGLRQRRRFVDLDGQRTGETIDGPGSPVVERGRIEALDALLDGAVEAMVLAVPLAKLPPAGVDALVRAHFRSVPIFTPEAFHEHYWRKIPVATMDSFWALRHNFRLARDSSWCLFKRFFDVGAAALGLFCTSPVLVLCAAALWIEDHGPVFYCQRRVRQDQQHFTLYKFRTMRADKGEGGLYTSDNDDRVTRVGRWLRRMRLDELPQLLNVLAGDMSVIGPRAEWERCVELYEREIPCYHFRHLVKPGITGWAQVNYPYGCSVADTVEKLTYDLYYIKNYSFLLDASIALKTLWVMLSFRGK